MLKYPAPVSAPVSAASFTVPTLAERVTAMREHRQVIADKWCFGTIIVERFITRFFVEDVHLLPDWTKYLDYPMLVLFAAYVLYATRERAAGKLKSGFVALTLALVIVVAFSALLNLQRLQAGALSLFVLGFFEPLAYMGLAFRLGSSKALAPFMVRLLMIVGWIQVVVVALVDLPIYLHTGNPDVISGTFGENAYQLTFFLLTWNVIVLKGNADGKMPPRKLLWVGLLQIVIVTIIFLAQFRSILPFAALTWIFTYFVVIRQPGKGWSKAVAGSLAGIIVCAVLFAQLISLVPQLKWAQVFQLVDQGSATLRSGKVESVVSFGQLIVSQPLVLLTGTGPGTYASRGFQTFSVAGARDSANLLYRQLFHTGYYTTDVAAAHTLPFAGLVAFGSTTVASPWFTWLAIPAEVGLPGTALILALYFRAMLLCWRHSQGNSDAQVLAKWVLIGMFLLLQMGVARQLAGGFTTDSAALAYLWPCTLLAPG